MPSLLSLQLGLLSAKKRIGKTGSSLPKHHEQSPVGLTENGATLLDESNGAVQEDIDELGHAGDSRNFESPHIDQNNGDIKYILSKSVSQRALGENDGMSHLPNIHFPKSISRNNNANTGFNSAKRSSSSIV